MAHWTVLAAPYYHFWMAALVLIAIALEIAIWRGNRDIRRRLKTLHNELQAITYVGRDYSKVEEIPKTNVYDILSFVKPRNKEPA